MSVVQQTPGYSTMPCGFEEEFVDFESAAHQYSISSCATDEWAISELDDEALGIVDKSAATANKPASVESGSSQRQCDEAKSKETVAARTTMKGTMSENGTSDEDLFGTSRNYSSGLGSGSANTTKSRPTMISAKYRLKEERRKVLKISINKLKKIEDPETSLRRSVLINNTMKRLQKEAREEKLQKQQLQSYPRLYSPYKAAPSATLTKDTPNDENDFTLTAISVTARSTDQSPSHNMSDLSPLSNDADKENAFPHSLYAERKNGNDFVKPDVASAKESELDVEDVLCNETMDEFVDVTGDGDDDEDDAEMTVSVMDTTNAPTQSNALTSNRCASAFTRKRSFEEVDDCDVHDVLSQFYMPPTPRMLTSIDDTDDEDEDVNVVDIDIVTPDITITNPSSSLDGIPNSKRPKCSDDDDDIVVEIVDPLKELNNSCEQVPSSNKLPIVCDNVNIEISSSRTLSSKAMDRVLETNTVPADEDDIEVVLEDSEGVEQRLMLCTGGTALTRILPVSTGWQTDRRSHSDAMCTPLPSGTDSLVTDNPQPNSRFDSAHPADKQVLSCNSNDVSGENNNNTSISNNNATGITTATNTPSVTDTADQQFSCGHTSIFGELQSVVFHSLIASLES